MSFTPMHAGRIKLLIDRLFTTLVVAFSWARECLVNAIEADATEVAFGIEPTAAARRGVFRRTIVDNGHGMSAAELPQFFLGYGVSGKAIGETDQNYGHGAKSSTLPRNHAGIYVVSKVADEPAHVIRIGYNAVRDDYGLYEWEVTDPEVPDGPPISVPVVEAFDDVHGSGIDFTEVLPHEHGTALILCGMTMQDHTAFGDEERNEPASGLTRYLNGRFDRLDGITVTVARPVGNDPTALDPALRNGTDYKTDTVHGARAIQEGGFSAPPERDLVSLSDGVVAEVFLAPEEENSRKFEAPERRGYIAVGLERPDGVAAEMFHRSTHHQSFKACGIHHAAVQRRTTVWFQVPFDGNGPDGVGALMNDARTELRWRHSDGTVTELPLRDWFAELSLQLPDVVVEALHDQTDRQALDLSEGDLERLKAEFGDRWRARSRRADPQGEELMDPEGVGHSGEHTRSGGGGGGRTSNGGRKPGTGSLGGPRPARHTLRPAGLPRGIPVREDDFPGERYQLVSYSPPSSAEPSGIVQLNIDHPVVRGEVDHWADQHVNHARPDIERVVHHVYLTAAIATVAHLESLRGTLGMSSAEVERWRDEDALSSAMLGLWPLEAHVIAQLRALGAARRRR